MSDHIVLTPRDARRLAIITQALHAPSPFGRGKNAVMRMIEQLGYVQIDTISVVERAHHHVIRTRIPNYRKKHLLDLQVRDRKVLEYWSHAAAFIPMDDYRFTIPMQENFRSGKDPWPSVEQKVMTYVLDRIKSDGPLMSKDFERADNPKGDGWWEWKPAKLALQRLFFEGALVVSHRQGFQRVYDTPERVLPASIDTRIPSQEEYADFLIDRYLKAHGFGTAKMISYLRRGMGSTVVRRLRERAGEDLVPVVIKRLPKAEFYAHADVMEISSKRIAKNVRVLSPFDNTVIQRERLAAIFDFEYQIECYVPRPKRVHGYFVLPLLYGDRFVGRMDCKADRKTGKFNIISLYLEKIREVDSLLPKLAQAIQEFANWNNCPEIEVGNVIPAEYKAPLELLLRES